MIVSRGKAGIDCSWQEPFPETTPCTHYRCENLNEARLAFVAHEGFHDNPLGLSISHLHHNELADGGPFWPHDYIAVAVYFCTKCAKITAIWNQA